MQCIHALNGYQLGDKYLKVGGTSLDLLSGFQSFLSVPFLPKLGQWPCRLCDFVIFAGFLCSPPLRCELFLGLMFAPTGLVAAREALMPELPCSRGSRCVPLLSSGCLLSRSLETRALLQSWSLFLVATPVSKPPALACSLPRWLSAV
jgi:hypothetical protein